MKLLAFASVFTFFFQTLFTSSAYAYVPKARQILSRTVKLRPEGVFQIEREVSLIENSQTLNFKEFWTVAGPNKMKVRIVGQIGEEKIDFEILYRDGRRHFFEQDGKLKAYNLSKDFIEPLLFERSASELGLRLSRLGILPPEALQKEKVPSTLSEVHHNSEPFTRLARVAGVVTYGIGEPTYAQASQVSPQIFIEQDVFQIRKLNLRSGSEIQFDPYKEYSKNNSFSTLETIRWNGKEALIKTVSVTSLPPAKTENAFSFDEFEKSGKRNGIKKQPSDSFVQEYFSRFR